MSSAPARAYWFARVPGRNKMVPVTREGWLVAAGFVAGMFGSGLVGALLATAGVWWWWAVMAVGMALSGAGFVTIAYLNCEPKRV
jgi:hypothetical protein